MTVKFENPIGGVLFRKRAMLARRIFMLSQHRVHKEFVKGC